MTNRHLGDTLSSTTRETQSQNLKVSAAGHKSMTHVELHNMIYLVCCSYLKRNINAESTQHKSNAISEPLLRDWGIIISE